MSLRRFDYITVPATVNTTAGFIPTAAAGIGPAPPVSKTDVLTFTPSRRDNGEGRTHDHGVAVRCLGLLATLSCTPVGTRIRISALGEPGAFLLHYRSIASVEGLEPSPCGFRGPVPCPVWRYGQISVVGFEPTASSFGGKRSHPLSYTDRTAERIRTSSTASVVRRFIR